MYIFGIIQLPESSIRLDIQYPPDIGHIIPKSGIQFKYPISGTIPRFFREKLFKLISAPLGRPFGRKIYIPLFTSLPIRGLVQKNSI